MAEHAMRIHVESGSMESRVHAMCEPCGWIGPDHGYRSPAALDIAHRWAEDDFKLHAAGKPVGRAEDERDLPGAPYKPPEEG